MSKEDLMDVFSPSRLPRSLQEDGNTGTQSLSAGVGGGGNMGVSVVKKSSYPI